ncbi:MAG: hypothetical protein KKA36_06595 [Gammaproteobacteria bacterium]|nr:hypothetical protein [Gammaproteobacteria bacterium]MBU2478742.1 hypothetical protein [Gammaproteobacteria bacterium]
MQNPSSAEVRLERLLALIERLQAETEGFFEQPEQEQLWYNRGYANGMIGAMDALGYAALLSGRAQADAPDLLAGCELLSWGRAYLHGQEVGERETYEVLSPKRAD